MAVTESGKVLKMGKHLAIRILASSWLAIVFYQTLENIYKPD
jgi:hypothetical protein